MWFAPANLKLAALSEKISETHQTAVAQRAKLDSQNQVHITSISKHLLYRRCHFGKLPCQISQSWAVAWWQKKICKGKDARSVSLAQLFRQGALVLVSCGRSTGQARAPGKLFETHPRVNRTRKKKHKEKKQFYSIGLGAIRFREMIWFQ